MRRITSGLAAAAAVVVAALLLSGCGGGGSGPAGNWIAAKPAKEIVAASEAAFRSARSVRVKLTGEDAGARIRMDLKLTRGKDAAGWIERAGVRVNIIVIDGGSVYLQGRKLWEQQGNAGVAELIGDRWVKAPREQAAEMNPFGNELTIRSLADAIFTQEATPPAFTSKSEVTVGGAPAVRLQAVDGRYFVAATGRPYPLRLVAERAGDIQFSQYDQDFAIKAPRGALDIDKLAG